ncbi:FISUMP domain-containing protein, partial [Bacteroidota bacterium]
STNAVTSITSISAVCGGNITDEGVSSVIERGICWDTIPNLTLSDNHTNIGSGAGSFSINLAGLLPNTTYFVRAYATNSLGTAYGNEISFKTLPDPFSCGDNFTDLRDGMVYSTVLIGSHCWFNEDLKVGTMINSSQVQSDNGTIEKYCYDNASNNCVVFGGLYKWDEMMQYTTSEGVQGICPQGWHLPTDSEWKTLEGNVDTQYPVGDSEWDGTGWRGSDVGSKLKEAGTTHWDSPNSGATNSSGFTALPGGVWNNPGYVYQGHLGYWWTSTQSGTTKAWRYGMEHNNEMVHRLENDKTGARSVRCVKN